MNHLKCQLEKTIQSLRTIYHLKLFLKQLFPFLFTLENRQQAEGNNLIQKEQNIQPHI